MEYPFKAIQQPDLPPFETLAFAGGGNHTQGNGRIGTAAPVEPTNMQLTQPTRAGLPSDSAPARPNPSEPVQANLLSAAPSVNFSISVPASNYRTLRDTDNVMRPKHSANTPMWKEGNRHWPDDHVLNRCWVRSVLCICPARDAMLARMSIMIQAPSKAQYSSGLSSDNSVVSSFSSCKGLTSSALNASSLASKQVS